MHACQACVSYSLIMRVLSCITLAVVILHIKVTVKCITLHGGGALIKAKIASVHYGLKAFLLLDICDVSNLAFWHVPFSFSWNFVFIY